MGTFNTVKRLLVAQYWNNIEIHLTSKAGFEKIDVSHHYCPEDTTYALLFKDMASINYWNLIRTVRAALEKIAILFLSPPEWSLFLELECSYSPGTDLRWINFWILIINKIHPIIQALGRHTHIQVASQKSGELKMCKSTRMSKLIFSMISVHSHIYYIYVKLSVT
jgi:hypothetical protein